MEQENSSSADDHDQLINIWRSFFCSYTSYLLSALTSLKEDSRLTLMPAAAAKYCEEVEGRAAAAVNIDGDHDDQLQDQKDHEYMINTTDHNFMSSWKDQVRHEVDMALVVAATKSSGSSSSKWCRSLKWKLLDHRHDYNNNIDQVILSSSVVVLPMHINNNHHHHHHYSSLLFHGSLSIIPPHAPPAALFPNLINYYPTPTPYTDHDQPAAARSSCDHLRASSPAIRSSSSFSTSSSSSSSSPLLMLYWRRRRRRKRFPKIRNGSKIIRRLIRRPAAKSVFKLKRRSNYKQQQQQLMYNYGKQLRVLRSLIPGGAEMKMDELFFELHNYVGHLKMQVTVLTYLVCPPPPPPPQPQLPPDPAAATLHL